MQSQGTSNKRLRANKVLAGQQCGACGQVLMIGEDVAQCNACGMVHHGACWDGAGGCSNTQCENRPLEQLQDIPAVAAAQNISPGYMKCPGCGNEVPRSDDFCVYCNAVLSPDGIYRGPRENAPGASTALICGLIGLIFCGPILGGIAISKANEAKRAIAANPQFYGGEGMATAGLILGVIDIIIFVLALFLRFAGNS